MRTYIVLGIALSAIGCLGIISSSSIFFGLITSGVFLVAYTHLKEGKKTKLEEPAASQISPERQYHSFCPSCGVKLIDRPLYCPLCGKKLFGAE